MEEKSEPRIWSQSKLIIGSEVASANFDALLANFEEMSKNVASAVDVWKERGYRLIVTVEEIDKDGLPAMDDPIEEVLRRMDRIVDLLAQVANVVVNQRPAETAEEERPQWRAQIWDDDRGVAIDHLVLDALPDKGTKLERDGKKYIVSGVSHSPIERGRARISVKRIE